MTPEARPYDVLAVGAHPDDLEAVMGGTAARLADAGRRVLFVDLCPGEPTRYAPRGVRHEQAEAAARLLGVDRVTLALQDRFIQDTLDARVAVAQLIRVHRPRVVFTTLGGDVHPDHRATTDIVTAALFYARLPKWAEVPGGERLEETAPHEVERLFFGHCRMESAWSRFDFAVDVSDVYERKLAALRAYAAVFDGRQADLPARYEAEDRYVGAQVGVTCAEAFRARSPLLVQGPEVFLPARFG